MLAVSNLISFLFYKIFKKPFQFAGKAFCFYSVSCSGYKTKNMQLNPALLFCLILILFFGCGKVEKKAKETLKVHEINIGILSGTVDAKSHKHNWQFYHYWHLDLLNDSFYVKLNPSMMGDSGGVTLAGGKLDFQNEPIINRFLEQEKNMEDGAKYFHNSDSGLYCFPTYLIQYKKNSATKFIFFNEHKYIF